MPEGFDPEAVDPAAFDMGISTLTRINFQLWKCNEAQSQNDVESWYRALLVVYKEADAFMNEKEQKVHEDEMRDAEKDYLGYTKYLSNYNAFPRTHPSFNPPRNIFDRLFSWEKKLRRVLDKKGLLMKKGDRADMAML